MLAQLSANRASLSLGRPASRRPVSVMAASAQEPTINFDRVTSGILVGSCLRNAADAAMAQQAGVSVVFSLQDATDLKDQGIDADAVAEACQQQGVRHVRCPTSDVDEEALQRNLPKAVAAFAREVAAAEGQGSAYVHCNGGRGRAPTIVTAYLFWLCGQTLAQAAATMTAGRKSSPKLPVIAKATADLAGGEVAGDHEALQLSEEQRASIKAALAALA